MTCPPPPQDTWDVGKYLRQELLVLLICMAGLLCGLPNVFQVSKKEDEDPPLFSNFFVSFLNPAS